MVESIRNSGVIMPIVVRSKDGKYEILAGHNRVTAAKEAGLKTVPAIVREGLSDDEAMFIVTETNLIQRSFADMKHSERAVALAIHYEAIKKKSGFRTDLLEGVEELTLSPVGTRLATKDKMAEQYGLSKNTIMRYLRINKLIPALKVRLDNDGIGMRVAETLSYLRKTEQKLTEKLLADGSKISIKIANALRDESAKGEMNKDTVKRLFEPIVGDVKIKPVKLSGQFLSRFFDDSKSVEEIEGVVAEALERYFGG